MAIRLACNCGHDLFRLMLDDGTIVAFCMSCGSAANLAELPKYPAPKTTTKKVQL